MKSNLSIFFLLLLMLSMSILRSHCKTQDHEDLWLLKVDIVFILIFRSHPFWFNFCILSSLFSLCIWLSSCLSIICWRNFSFPISWPQHPLSKIIWPFMWGFVSEFPYYSICLIPPWFCSKFWNQEVWNLHFYPLFQAHFDYFGSTEIPYEL